MPRLAPSKSRASVSRRRATNVTLSEPHPAGGRAFGINVSDACERGLATAIAERQRTRRPEENKEAMDA